jgi:hypothetical protein
MLDLDQVRLESAQLKAELGHLPSNKFPGTHAVVSARLLFLEKCEKGLVASAQSIAAGYAPDPAWEEQKRQERIEMMKSAIPPLQGELTRVPVWDTARREQIEAAIANYEKQVNKLEAQAV